MSHDEAMPTSHLVTAFLLLNVFVTAGTSATSACRERGCPGGLSGVAIASVVQDNGQPEGRLIRWISMLNHGAYARQHSGFRLYVATESLCGRMPVWDKLVLAMVALQHSCAKWVWLLDADAFLMNMQLSVLDVIEEQLRMAAPAADPDVLVARGCYTDIFNAGSMLLRNTPWTFEHLASAWDYIGPRIEHSSDWQEQAAFVHMQKHVPSVAEHYLIVPQTSINSFPPPPLMSCGAPYKEGHLVLHFVGSSKAKAFAAGGEWLQRIPLQATSKRREVATSRRPIGEQVAQAAGAGSQAGSNVEPYVFHVVPSQPMGDSLTCDQFEVPLGVPGERIKKVFEVHTQTYPDGNPGWPVAVPLLMSRLAP